MLKPLTSLRFFFALMVLGSHLSFLDVDNNFYLKLHSLILKEGFIGVSFFFILSGFILALNYKTKISNNEISLKAFWIARIARIYPLHLFALILSIPLVSIGLFHDTFKWLVTLLLNVFLLQSFIPIKEIYFSFNAPSWSISDEMFFYILFPFLILLFTKFRKAIGISLFLVLLIPIAIVLTPESLQHPFFYIHPFFRIADFTLGILLYFLYKKGMLAFTTISKSRATWLEILSLCTLGIFFALHSYIPISYRYSCYYWIPMTLMIFTFALQSGYISHFLSRKLFVLLGEISFSFYLLHGVMINYVCRLNGKFQITDSLSILIPVIFFATLIASYFSYYYIERPANAYIKSKYLEYNNIQYGTNSNPRFLQKAFSILTK